VYLEIAREENLRIAYILDTHDHASHVSGHRPEHIVFAAVDLPRGSAPWTLLTGDSPLVGDLARPDLVEAIQGAISCTQACGH
jgi:glyoxylase-like metal-dependent hydrolase (beta-lactamase superfamily II)